MRTLLLANLLATTIIVLPGCAAQTSTVDAPVETAQVTMPLSYRFDPPRIQVPAGTRVSWRNTDNFTHAVSVSGGEFPFLSLSPGQSGSLTFDQPGTYDYVCTYHAQDMRGTIIVVGR